MPKDNYWAVWDTNLLHHQHSICLCPRCRRRRHRTAVLSLPLLSWKYSIEGKKKKFGRHDWRKYILKGGEKKICGRSRDDGSRSRDTLVVTLPLWSVIPASKCPDGLGNLVQRCYLLVTTCQPQSTGNRLRKKRNCRRVFQTSAYLRSLNGLRFDSDGDQRGGSTRSSCRNILRNILRNRSEVVPPPS